MFRATKYTHAATFMIVFDGGKGKRGPVLVCIANSMFEAIGCGWYIRQKY